MMGEVWRVIDEVYRTKTQTIDWVEEVASPNRKKEERKARGNRL